MPKKRPAPPPSDDTITHEPPTVATHILTSRDGPAGREVHRAENEAPAHCIDERARASWEQSLSVGDPYGARTYRSIENIWGAGGVEDQKLDALVKARPGQRSIEEVLRIVVLTMNGYFAWRAVLHAKRADEIEAEMKREPRIGQAERIQEQRELARKFGHAPAAKGGAVKALLLEHVDEVVGAQATRARRVDLATMVKQFEKRGAELARIDPYMAYNVEALALILFDQYREALRRSLPRKPRVSVFGSTRSVFSAWVSGGLIGMGSQNLQIAESKGRTRSLWDEVGVRGTTHTGSGSVKSLAMVERQSDAERALSGADLDIADQEALQEILSAKKPDMRAIVTRYRYRLAELWQSARCYGLKEDWAGEPPPYIRERITDLTGGVSDEAIKQRIKRARKQAETHLRRLPALAEQTARAMGDKSFLQSIIPPVKERSQKPERPPMHIEPIAATTPGSYL